MATPAATTSSSVSTPMSPAEATGVDLEAEVAAAPAAELLHDEARLLPEGLLELVLADGARLDQDVAELAAVGRLVLALEGRGERLGRDEPAADQDVAERLADRARGGVDDPPQPHHDHPVGLASAERHLPGAVVEREEVEQLRELDLLEAAGEAHGASGSSGPSSTGAPGSSPRIRRTASWASGHDPRRRARVRAGSAPRARGPDRAEGLHRRLAHAGLTVAQRLRQGGHGGLGGRPHVLEGHGRGHAQGGVGVGERRDEVGDRGLPARAHAPEGVGGRDPLGRRAGAQELGDGGDGGLPSVMSRRRARPLFSASGPRRSATSCPGSGGFSFSRQPGRSRRGGRGGRAQRLAHGQVNPSTGKCSAPGGPGGGTPGWRQEADGPAGATSDRNTPPPALNADGPKGLPAARANAVSDPGGVLRTPRC